MNAVKEGKTFVFFLFCGGIAAVVELGGRWLVNFWLPYKAAIIVGRLAGMLVAFLLFKFMVFKTANTGQTQREGAWFILVNLLAILQVLVISVGLADYLFPWLGMDFHPKDIAHIIGVTTTAVSSFIGHKFFTFKQEAQ
ncbi:MAG: GtrA family protein [Desulfobulbaceae bacterium]|jgi:putative flippase GtrA|nr:GtrA family protein [Desulfobulbaceae bacterium]